MDRKKQRISGVFPHLVNAAAYVDTIWIGLRGQRRQKILTHITPKKNRAIGGVGRMYARCVPGRNRLTGNRMQFRYGALRPYEASGSEDPSISGLRIIALSTDS